MPTGAIVKAMTTDMGADALKPQIRKWVNERRKEYPEIYSIYMNKFTTDEAYIEDYELGGFGVIPKLDEGDVINFVAPPSGNKTRYQPDTYQAAFAITRRDKKYNKIGKVNKFISRMERAFRVTTEQVAAMVFNLAFSAAFVGNDNVPLVSGTGAPVATGHTNVNGDTGISNTSTAASISPVSLEAALGVFLNMKGPDGFPIVMKPKFLVVPAGLQLVAERAVGAANYYATAGSGAATVPSGADTGVPSIIKKYGLTVVPNPYITVNGGLAWFLLADKDEHELQVIWGELPKDRAFDDNYTEDSVYSTLMELVSGFSTWMGVYGNYGQ